MRDFSEYKHSFGMQPLQKIQLSLSMRQSLDVLQMPIDDLSFWVEEQIQQNPLLDWKDTPSKKSKPLEIEIAYEPSLFEYLMQQARLQISDPLALEQIEWIIGNLEPTGFFTGSFEAVPCFWNPKNLSFLLEQLKQFEPIGIGARDVQESLLLQLKALGKENTLSYLLVKEHLSDILQGKMPFIQKKCQVDEQTLHEAIYCEIASLDPFPGLRFQKKHTIFITPDVFFYEAEGTWNIEINEEKLPQYTLRSFAQNTPSLSPEDKLFCSKHTSQAKSMESMIEKRRHTLRKVAYHLVKKQISYLKEESYSLLPLSIAEVASELELHESTIARAINNKYIECKWGIIPLKSLLSKHLNKSAEDISSDQAHKLLQKLILEENKKHPLSDREILEKMQKIGVPCARRTVTKYRKDLNIPPRRFRRKLGST
jgi:RNA polymerase sigma-54 factor